MNTWEGVSLSTREILGFRNVERAAAALWGGIKDILKISSARFGNQYRDWGYSQSLAVVLSLPLSLVKIWQVDSLHIYSFLTKKL